MTEQGHSQSTDSVLMEPLHPDRLIPLLEETLNQFYPAETRKQSHSDRGQHNARTRDLRQAQVRFNAFRSTIARFGEFLANRQLTEIGIDERLIQDFIDHLSTAGNPRSYLRNHRAQIRRLVNALPCPPRRRELASLQEFNRAHRWDSYSEDTPDILNDFVRNGRRLKPGCTRQAPVLSSSPLAQNYREHIAREVFTFLRVIEAKDILQVTADDVEEFIDYYESNDKRQTALSILNYIHPLFSNLLARGKITVDPLADIPRKINYKNLDYVAQPEMDKLGDLTSVDMNDFMDVRGRLLSFTIYYDFALRNREGALVRLPDLNLNGHIQLVLPKEIQKVQREDSLLFSYFPEVTRPLLTRYLELRDRKKPATDILLVSDNGQPLGADGCRYAVKDHCDRLGIKTFAGKTPTPHRLRHSFGSLNIKPLGRCLDIIEVKEQYRHSSIETTYKLYVTKNVILRTQRYEATMRSNGYDVTGGNGNGQRPNGNGQVQAIVFMPADPVVPPVAPSATPSPEKVITEDEAVRQVRGLGLNYKTLRAYAFKVGKVCKNGRGYDYPAGFIADLAGNYFTTQEAIDFLQMPRSSFFAWRNGEGIACIQIGQVGLYRKEAILLKKRAG